MITNVYIANEVAHSNSLEAVNNLIHLTYLLAQSAIIIRNFDISYKTGRKTLYSDDEFLFIIEELKKMQVKVLDDYDMWSYCKSSKVVKKDVVPYWSIDRGATIKYANLHKVIEILISNVKTI